MARRQKIEDRLAALVELLSRAFSSGGSTDEAVAAVTEALHDSSHLVVARAARGARELAATELIAPLIEAYDRLVTAGPEKDKTCAGKTEVVRALVTLEANATELFLDASRCVQLEGSYGPPVDAAAELRSHAAYGIALTRPNTATLELVRLLADPEVVVRRSAAEALGAFSSLEAEPILRLKVVLGREEPEVLSACFSTLLRLEPSRSLRFVAGYLTDADLAVAETAALALGESRRDEALRWLLEPLAEGEPSSFDADRRRFLLMAISLLRKQPAFDHLLDVVENGPEERALEALEALSIHRHDRSVVDPIEQVVERRSSPSLAREFQRRFS